MKKLIAICLVLLLVFSVVTALVSCDKNNNGENDKTSDDQPTEDTPSEKNDGKLPIVPVPNE